MRSAMMMLVLASALFAQSNDGRSDAPPDPCTFF